ncbi:ribosome biogenesis GTPase YqeH [Halobacillus kuroshimensis]|uniref:Ribosome biogenesis GTPase YqeH n=1 Tax=Halobacillus kuroshimensis TaxID=302481 RepID=A0ABS3DZD5_9BACI|nr:ribosome biogenesis GTPase YqeH [Halobacillus kuroshimensis]MBN8236706.1 ribosome biogenesis GTPase YqeH [Halobacillus kuroshimensis]
MAEIQCQGCGAEIQTTNPEQPGYAPASALNREDIICKRCFRLKHYNEVQDVPYQDDDFLEMLNQINGTKSLVIQLIDIFDFNGSFIPGLKRLTGNNPVLLVGNKMDVLPKSVNHNKVKHWLKRSARENGLEVEDVFLISAEKNQGVEELSRAVEDYRNGKDVYVVGTTNVGKSTFINTLISNTSGVKDAITTSYFPGTTLGFIDIPLDEQSSMFDTPGVIHRHQMAHYVSDKDLKLITPRKEVKPKVYQLNEQQTLFIGGLARLDFEKGERSSFIGYFSNELHIHRTKMEKADDLYKNHLGELLTPPDQDTKEKLPPLKAQTLKITEPKTDIVFSGLGWITVPEGDVTVTAHVPEGVKVSLRASLI